jgi:hypothetical protein
MNQVRKSGSGWPEGADLVLFREARGVILISSPRFSIPGGVTCFFWQGSYEETGIAEASPIGRADDPGAVRPELVASIVMAVS